jgi:plasmid stabilization system protein ParE
MRLPVVLKPIAEVEFEDAFDWYQHQQPGLGLAFVARVQAVFDRIPTMPKVHAIVFKNLRRAVVKKFPYAIYYRAEATRVVVVSVFHSNRDPRIWQSRA